MVKAVERRLDDAGIFTGLDPLLQPVALGAARDIREGGHPVESGEQPVRARDAKALLDQLACRSPLWCSRREFVRSHNTTSASFAGACIAVKCRNPLKSRAVNRSSQCGDFLDMSDGRPATGGLGHEIEHLIVIVAYRRERKIFI